MQASPLARILFVVYSALVVYASLYPFQGWRDQGLSPFDYLAAPWPRYLTGFDVASNVLGYLPLGLLAVLALHPRLRGAAALAAATVAAALLSLGLEAAQTYLPARVASNVDLMCNVAGGGAGAALGLAVAPYLLSRGRLRHLRAAMLLPGAAVDFGVVLLGLWLFTQLDPSTLLFGSGDLRDLFAPGDGRAYTPQVFVTIEALTATANLSAVLLLASALAAPGRRVRPMLVALLGAALMVKTAAFAVIMRAEDVLAWLTPGAEQGIVAGLALALLAVSLPRIGRLALAAVLLMGATVLVNLSPPNPYLSATLKVWRQGHFLNFNGLTRLVSGAWPFAALGYLIFLSARRGREALR